MVLVTKSINRDIILRIIIIYAFLASIAYFIQKATLNYTFDYGSLSSNEVSQYALRFEGVKKFLPSLKRVGYIVDETENLGFTGNSRKLTLAQYILAPYVDYACGDCRFYLSDFHRPIDLNRYASQQGFVLFKDYGNGVALFHRR